MRLFDFLFPPRVDEEALRSVPDDAFLAKVAPRLSPETRPGTVVLLSFGDAVVRAAVHEAKYHGSARAFRLLGAVLADYLRDADDVGRGTSHIYLVPVPLGRERFRERGFNQAEEIARHALRSLAAPSVASCEGGNITVDSTLLVRVRETASQVSLPRSAREKNMRDAFQVAEGARPVDPTDTYVLVDDVLTTGATLQSCIDTLKDAGATHVIPLALAH